MNTSENSLLTSMLLKSSPEIETNLRKLMEGIPCRTIIHDSMVYENMKGGITSLNQAQKDPVVLFTQLVMTGYLKIDSIDFMTAPDYECTVKIPKNRIKGGTFRQFKPSQLISGKGDCADSGERIFRIIAETRMYNKPNMADTVSRIYTRSACYFIFVMINFPIISP